MPLDRRQRDLDDCHVDEQHERADADRDQSPSVARGDRGPRGSGTIGGHQDCPLSLDDSMLYVSATHYE